MIKQMRKKFIQSQRFEGEIGRKKIFFFTIFEGIFIFIWVFFDLTP